MQLFILDPLKYTKQRPPLADTKPQVAIIGPPLSGKTTLAMKLVKEYKVEYVNLPIAINYILRLPKCPFRDHIEDILLDGDALSATKSAEILSYYLKCKACHTNGYVIDGYPETLDDCKLLKSYNIIPKQVYVLSLPSTEVIRRSIGEKDVIQRGIDDNKHTPNLKYFTLWTQDQYKYYQNNILSIEAFYKHNYDNIHYIDGTKNRWFMSHQTTQYLDNHLTLSREFNFAVKYDYSASIYDICIHIDEIGSNRSNIETYCPVNWCEKRELIIRDNDRQYLAYYKGKYYNLAGKTELDKFLSQPSKYLYYAVLPRYLPHRIPLSESIHYINTISYNSLCPVTYHEGRGTRDWESMVTGDSTLLVVYNKKIYSFANEVQLNKFMRTPERYLTRYLPLKLPPKVEQISLTELRDKPITSLVGYLEQSFAEVLIQGMTFLSDNRIKYPSLSVRQTALMYMSLYLKAHDTTQPDHITHRQKHRLDQFIKECQLSHQILKEAPRGSGLKATKALSRSFLDNSGLFDKIILISMAELKQRFLREKKNRDF